MTFQDMNDDATKKKSAWDIPECSLVNDNRKREIFDTNGLYIILSVSLERLLVLAA